MADEGFEVFFVKDVGDAPHAGVDSDSFTVGDGDAGAFLAAVL